MEDKTAKSTTQNVQNTIKEAARENPQMWLLMKIQMKMMILMIMKNRINRKKLCTMTEEIQNDTLNITPKEPIFSIALNYLKLASQWLFFEYENINMDFSQSSFFKRKRN